MHPLLESLEEFNTDQLLEKINFLNDKIIFCSQTGRHQMTHQLRSVLFQYQEEYNQRIANQATALERRTGKKTRLIDPPASSNED